MGAAMVSFSVLTATAFAQNPNGFQTGTGLGNTGATGSGGITINGTQGVIKIACYIFSIVYYVALTVAVVFVLYAAYMFITAGDNAEKVTQARKSLIYSAIGILVVLVSASAPYIVSNFLNTALSNQVPWSGGCQTTTVQPPG